jgi:TolA-binding protein
MTHLNHSLFGTLFLLVILGTQGCISTSRERELQNDLFAVKARVLELENQLSSSSEKGTENESSLSKRIAATNTTIDRVDVRIKKLVGDVDALKVGVATGRLPGSEEGSPSVASRMDQMEMRLDAIEEILSKQNNKSDNKRSAETKNASTPESLAEFVEAFEKKKYKMVYEEGPAARSQFRGNDRHELDYLVAESAFKLGNIRDAALKFNELSERKPPDPIKRKTLLRLGDSFKHLGDQATAKIYYSELVEKYADSDEAKSADEKIKALDQG